MLKPGDIRTWAKLIKRDVVTLYVAATDRRTPRMAKFLSVAVVAYALSPIDLIPDFIPVLGYLDDIVIVPLGIMLALRLIPPDLLAEFRREAETRGRLPATRSGAIIVIVVWAAAVAAAGWLLLAHA